MGCRVEWGFAVSIMEASLRRHICMKILGAERANQIEIWGEKSKCRAFEGAVWHVGELQRS